MIRGRRRKASLCVGGLGWGVNFLAATDSETVVRIFHAVAVRTSERGCCAAELSRATFCSERKRDSILPREKFRPNSERSELTVCVSIDVILVAP